MARAALLMNTARAQRLKIAFFGSASRFSQLAFEQLAATQEIVALVLPQPAKRGLRGALRQIAGMGASSPLERVARAAGIPIMTVSGELSGAYCEQLRVLRPDLLCVALFPKLLPRDLLEVAALGAINAHPSLLPRHRGPLPLFWTYHGDDRVAGVTVHHASQRFDAGDVIAQVRFALPRGYPVADLDRDVAQHAAPLLREAVEQLATGCAPRVAQDEGAATYAPLLKQDAPMVPFGEWDAERVWHFLAGLCSQYREPLVDENGREVRYERVTGYREGPPQGEPGSVEHRDGGWTLHCRNGVVHLGGKR
jgi:methionyl-tRNA formyltransferase